MADCSTESLEPANLSIYYFPVKTLIFPAKNLYFELKSLFFQLGGPIWSAPIHDETFVSRVLTHVEDNPHLFGTAKRIQGVLSMVREELQDVPLYHTLDKLFGRVHLETMPMLVMR